MAINQDATPLDESVDPLEEELGLTGLEEVEEGVLPFGSAFGAGFFPEIDFLATGSYTTDLEIAERSNPTFNTGWVPLFIWRLGDKFLQVNKLDFIPNFPAGYNIFVFQSYFTWFINDCWMLRTGLFPLGLGIFTEQIQPSWINKLPTNPLVRDVGFFPSSSVGVQLKGARYLCLPWCKNSEPFMTYDLWLVNGPRESFGEPNVGATNFDNNYDKAIGGRVAY